MKTSKALTHTIKTAPLHLKLQLKHFKYKNQNLKHRKI